MKHRMLAALAAAGLIFFGFDGPQKVADNSRPNFNSGVAHGETSGWSIVHKFGRNAAVGTTYVPVALGGVYRTPQPAAATAVRVKAGNAADTAGGAGAREVTVIGIDENGDEVSEALATAGESASSNSSTTFIRIYRAYVSSSGTYATQSAGSHTAAIVIENAAGTEDWLTIDATNFPKGQSEIGVYTVPNGYEASIGTVAIFSDSTKTTNLLLFKREGATDAAPPYSAMREQWAVSLEGGFVSENPNTNLGPYPAGTDIGFMAKVDAGTAQVAVDFEILLKQVP